LTNKKRERGVMEGSIGLNFPGVENGNGLVLEKHLRHRVKVGIRRRKPVLSESKTEEKGKDCEVEVLGGMSWKIHSKQGNCN